jgi:nuclear receptor interaction protein
VAVGHPYEPLLAVSGIDYTVKLFSPDSKLQQEFGEKTQKAQRAKNQGVDWTYSGPASRRLMGSSKSILDRNQVNNETGRSNTILSVRFFPGNAISFASWLSLYSVES